MLALILNAAAVWRLRNQTMLINPTEKSGHVRSESAAKQEAAVGLQRVSVALALIFAITSGPFQVTNSIEIISCTHF